MKSFNTRGYTKGFFDFGIALIILALSGTTAYVTVSQHDEAATVAAKEQTQTRTP